jgi:hypothetical protein
MFWPDGMPGVIGANVTTFSLTRKRLDATFSDHG